MDAVTRLASPPQRERHRHRRQAMTSALLAVLAALAACGGGGTSTQSDAQIAQNDINAGLSAGAAGRLSEAATDYKNAISHDPHNKIAYYDLGVVEQAMGQNAAAELNYRTTLQIDPNWTGALYNLAILRTVPSPAEAEELYRHVISLQPQNGTPHLNLGFLLRSEGRIAEGNAELTIAVSLNPSLASRIPPRTLATPRPAATSKPSPTP
jgi:Tfp pilus assembly protein PilF